MSDITNSALDRQNILNNPFALEKIQEEVKNFPYFEMEGKVFILKQDVVEFYQVSEDTIDRILNENEQELRKNGYEVLTGKRLKIAKNIYDSGKPAGIKTVRLGVFDFRAFLNIGMLVQNSLVAKELRSKILDIVVDVMRAKTGGKTKYINQRDDTFVRSYLTNQDYRKKFTDALKDFVSPDLGNFKYPYFTDLIYKDLFGENAREYRQLLKLGAREKLRHTLYREILDVVSGYENGVADALQAEFAKQSQFLNQEQTESVFKMCFESPFLKPVKDTARTLMASRDVAFRDIIHEALEPYLASISEEEYKKFLSQESEITETETGEFLDLIDKNKEIFKRLKDR